MCMVLRKPFTQEGQYCIDIFGYHVVRVKFGHET